MPCDCLNYGYAPEMGPHVEGHHPRCPRVAELRPGKEFIVSEEKVPADEADDDEPGNIRRSYAADLKACHQIDGIMDKLDERTRLFVVQRMVARYGKAEG